MLPPLAYVATVATLLAAISSLTFAANFNTGASSSPSLDIVKQWKTLTYNFVPNAPVQDTNFYNPSNIVATGFAVTDDRIFIATPKLFSGVPSTLNWIPRNDVTESPVLRAYPDWSYSTTARTDFNCSDLVLISVYRIRMDSCNRLWVLDAGVSRSLEDYEVTCPPKILIFDLKTNQVVRRIDFPRGVLRGESLFTNMVIDETTSKSKTCDDVFVYISDTVEPGIIVYDSVRDITWRLSHPAMYPDPDFAETTILNDKFVLMDGIVGLVFDSRNAILFFQPFATDRIFSITRETLRAGPIAINQVLPVKLVGKKSSQGIGLALSPIDGSLIFGPSTETAIATWNPVTNEQNILSQDKERLQFVADINTTPYDHGYVYAVSSKFHRFFLKNVNTNEFNIRIVRVALPGYKPTAAPFTSPFGVSSSGFTSSHLPNYYQNSNNLQQKSNSLGLAQGYFTKPVSSRSTHPYSFENNGIINYSAKNPFTALNHGESFPPAGKAQRNQDQNSFLEGLATISALPQSSSRAVVSTLRPSEAAAISAFRHYPHTAASALIPSAPALIQQQNNYGHGGGYYYSRVARDSTSK